MPKTILYTIGAACLIALCALIATCRPAPGPQPEATASSTSADASGAGGAAAPAESAATGTASTGVAEPQREPDGCEVRQVKHTACDNPGDCYDGTACSEDACDLSTPPSPPDPYGRRGTCRWTTLPDGAGCDVSDGADSCQSGVCCPPGVLPPATPAAPPTAAVIAMPGAR